MNTQRFAAVLVLSLLAAGCDATGPNGTSQVAVRFGTSSPSASRAPSDALFSTSAAGELVVSGENGTLTIRTIGLIVSELELERLESECDNSGSGNLCDDYEAPISFLLLPLDGSAITVATDAVPAGLYDELDFEVEDVEPDADDSAEKRQRIADLAAAIRTQYGFTDFPAAASMVVEGDFTDAEGTRSFRAYFDADIDVELRFDPALEVGAEGSPRFVTVDVQPALWFRRADGIVWDLSDFDYGRTQALVDFDFEMPSGFSRVSLED